MSFVLGFHIFFKFSVGISRHYLTGHFQMGLDAVSNILLVLELGNQLTIEDFTNKNETGLFPTFNFGLEISEDETLTFGYNRRIRRPWSRFINPFPTKVSPINIFRGNPNLDPTYSNNIDFGYLKRYKSSFTINTSAYYQKSTNTFNFISEQTGETAEINGVDVPITERYPINLSTNTRFGFELNLSYRKGRKWNISSNFNVYSNKVEGSYNDIVYDNETLCKALSGKTIVCFHIRQKPRM